MKTKTKFIVGIINCIILGYAIKWYFRTGEEEPIIVILGQIIAILAILFENQVSKITTKKIEDSTLKIKGKKGDKIYTKDVKGSKIDIDIKD